MRVSANGVVIAELTDALTLKEASYPAVNYLPRKDANMALLSRSERVTHCPYKGDANYFSIDADGKAHRRCDLDLRKSVSGHDRNFRPPRLVSRQGQDRGSGVGPNGSSRAYRVRHIPGVCPPATAAHTLKIVSPSISSTRKITTKT